MDTEDEHTARYPKRQKMEEVEQLVPKSAKGKKEQENMM